MGWYMKEFFCRIRSEVEFSPFKENKENYLEGILADFLTIACAYKLHNM